MPSSRAISRVECATRIRSSTCCSRGVSCGIAAVAAALGGHQQPVDHPAKQPPRRPDGPGGHHFNRLPHHSRTRAMPQIGPGPGDDRVHHQFIVALRPNHDRAHRRTRRRIVSSVSKPAGRRMQVDNKVLERRRSPAAPSSVPITGSELLPDLRRGCSKMLVSPATRIGSPATKPTRIGLRSWTLGVMQPSLAARVAPPGQVRRSHARAHRRTCPSVGSNSHCRLAKRSRSHSFGRTIPCCFWYLPLRSA